MSRSPRPPVDRTLAKHVEHLYLWTRPTLLTVNCIPTGLAMKQDERAPFRPGLAPSPTVGVPPGEFVGQEGLMRQRNPGPGGAGPRQTSMASGKRGANGQSGGSAASDGGAPGIGYQPLALRGVAPGRRQQPRKEWTWQPTKWSRTCSSRRVLLKVRQSSQGDRQRH